MKTLILNGSPRGKNSNCQILIQKVIGEMKQLPEWKNKNSYEVIHLAEISWTQTEKKDLFNKIISAQGFIFTTGTYWDSWGSPLQVFLENITDLEGTPAFVGKPSVVMVLNHSVGGKGVLSRLQGVLSTLGCFIPPMSGFVYAWETDQLLKNKNNKGAAKDLWTLEDLTQIIDNFSKALQININWQTWPVDDKDYRKVWLKL